MHEESVNDLRARAEKILVEEEFPIMPIYIYVNQGLLSEQVLGWHKNVRDLPPWQFIWLEK